VGCREKDEVDNMGFFDKAKGKLTLSSNTKFEPSKVRRFGWHVMTPEEKKKAIAEDMKHI
jgi:hypothetical protein